MHTFQMSPQTGRDLGPMALGWPDWPLGSVTYQGGPKPNLRVVEHCRQDDGLVLAVQEV